MKIRQLEWEDYEDLEYTNSNVIDIAELDISIKYDFIHINGYEVGSCGSLEQAKERAQEIYEDIIKEGIIEE